MNKSIPPEKALSERIGFNLKKLGIGSGQVNRVENKDHFLKNHLASSIAFEKFFIFPFQLAILFELICIFIFQFYLFIFQINLKMIKCGIVQSRDD